MRDHHALLSIPIALGVLTVAGAASAGQGDHRVFGIGTALGAGVATDSVGFNFDDPIPDDLRYAVELPTLELQGFLPNEWSIDLSLPVTNMIVGKAATDVFTWRSDVFLNFNLGSGIVRGILGPGIGFAIIVGNSISTGTLRLPAELGVEINDSDEDFGFKIMARPWLEFLPDVRGTDPVGAGVVGLVGFSGYFKK
ncbi:MAG TPA: hypothetical protein VL400_21930 [Polyangiaceae bacterium]|jgi:hypothetical protein|nr:hypothetical protein [Polyangiaceae bacterium]